MAREHKGNFKGKGKFKGGKEKDDEPHGIRLPGSLLDELKASSGADQQIEGDNRYQLSSNFEKKKNGKSQGKKVSRKDERKAERQAKKKRKVENNQKQRVNLQQHQQQQQPHQQTKSNLKRTSETKPAAKKSVKFSAETKAGPDDEDEVYNTDSYEDDEQDFDEDDFDSDIDMEDEEDQPQTAEETMAALMALKKNKGKSPAKPANESKKPAKESKKPAKESKKPAKKTDIDPLTESLLRRDDDDIKHYAKLLGMKSTSVKAISRNEGDGLDDLLEGLDFLDNYGSDAQSSDGDEEDYGSKKSKKRALSESEDDEEDEDDDEDDFEGFEDEEDQPQTVEDTMAALMAMKAKKDAVKKPNGEPKKESKKKVLTESEAEDDFEEDYEEDYEDDDESEDEDDFEGFEDDEDQPQTVEDTMAALMAMKANKTKKESVKKLNDEAKKESKKVKESKKEKEQEKKKEIDPLTESLLRRDDDDIKHYAKLLGMKSTKVKDMSKNEGDGLDDLFDGLDFLDDYGALSGEDEEANEDEEDESEESESEENDEEGVDDGANDDEEIVENPFSSDDEINSSDFDESFGSGEEDGFEEEDGETIMAAAKENPYAPAGPAATTVGGGKYIPPALRAKMAAEQGNDPNSAEFQALKKQVKGPLNRLAESNVLSITSEIIKLYQSNARQLVTEAITSVVIDAVKQQGVLLDTFVVLYAALIAGVYRTQGVEAGAYFVQTLIEEFESSLNLTDGAGKQAGNLVSLICGIYSFGVIGCKLVYGLIKELLHDITEAKSELLLRIVRNAGTALRADDPSALKEIIVELQSAVLGKQTNERTKFLIETITDLKNNRSKLHSEMTGQLITNLKKQMNTIKNTKFSDPLQVSLEDIHSVATKGKWWVVGSAWRNNLHSSSGMSVNNDIDPDVNQEELKDILDSAEPNWLQLAKSNRMNTEIRRAIFISIVSSQDYLDAFTKLDKLRLKRSQEREIPKILLHCVGMEAGYNPYYGLLGNKLSQGHAMRKGFQFCFWDLIKEIEGDDDDDDDSEDSDNEFSNKRNKSLKGLDGDDDDEETKLRKLVNLGKFYGALIAEGSLGLHALKDVNFVSLNEDMSVFLEVLLIQFIDLVGKKSEIAAFGSGIGDFTATAKVRADDLKFKDDLLISRLGKCDRQRRMLMGLQWFLQERVRGSDLISGRKQKKRVEWGCDAGCDVIEELVKNAEDE